MTKIILCCAAGMSTSLFVEKTKKHAEEIGEQIDIKAIGVSELDNYLSSNPDVIVLGPQIRFQKDKVVEKTDIPVMVIDMRDYGMMNVKKVLPEILSLVKK